MISAQKTLKLAASVVALSICAQQAHAAIALDRTRVIYDGAKNSMSVTITNQNKALPYLAQSWIDDANGNKIQSPLMALPPVQRVEPGAKGQVKIQVSGAQTLPQDRESLFYFNVREIPPKSNKPNTLQLALQTRVKLFYRPKALQLPENGENEMQKQLTLVRAGDGYQLTNPTPYFVTVITAGPGEQGDGIKDFKPVMVSPKSNISLGANASALGAHPVLTFINDFGGRPKLTFNCSGSTCTVDHVKEG